MAHKWDDGFSYRGPPAESRQNPIALHKRDHAEFRITVEQKGAGQLPTSERESHCPLYRGCSPPSQRKWTAAGRWESPNWADAPCAYVAGQAGDPSRSRASAKHRGRTLADRVRETSRSGCWSCAQHPQKYVLIAKRFVDQQFGTGPVDWRALQADHVTVFVTREAETKRGFGRKAAPVAIRAVLRFLVYSGDIRPGLEAGGACDTELEARCLAPSHSTK